MSTPLCSSLGSWYTYLFLHPYTRGYTNNALDYQTNGLYRTPNPNPNSNPLVL